MKIAATMVGMDAARNYTEVEQNNTTWLQGRSIFGVPDQTAENLSGRLFNQNLFSLIHTSKASQQSSTGRASSEDSVSGVRQITENLPYAQQKGALAAMVEEISGTPVNIKQVEAVNQNQTAPPSPLSLRGARLTSTAIHVEQEAVCYQADGMVQTECGRSISFNLGVQMQRSEVSVQSTGLSRYAIDPIVLNFEEPVSLCDQTCFSFDLDGDGSREELAGLGSGSGFLALDQNGDGSINDGFELFGPSSGSGFGELAALDEDGNFWIDENDPIFNQLLVWFAPGQDGSRLVSLQEAGVGAISVAHLGTEFTLKGDQGQPQGKVKASGLFLMENGEPKSLQEIDIAPLSGSIIGKNAGSTAQTDIIHQSVERLREIIFWQRFKLQMMMAARRLKPASDEMLERLQHLSGGVNRSFLSLPKIE